MKRWKITISTDKVGSEVEREIEIEDEANPYDYAEDIMWSVVTVDIEEIKE